MRTAENSRPSIRLAVVDDHTLLRKGLIDCLLSQMSDCEVVMEAEDGLMLKEGLQTLNGAELPDIVLLDVNMPRMDGFETLAWLKRYCPKVLVIMITMYNDQTTVIRCLRLGANAFLSKEVEMDELVFTIRMVKQKGEYYSSFVAETAVAALKEQTSSNVSVASICLTAKELEFLKLACSELTYKEIADKMYISQRTVDIYRDRLFEKLNVRSRIALCLFAIRNKLFIPLEQQYSSVPKPSNL